MNKKIAVIGGGIFGITAALQLSRTNSVDLYEAKKDILQCASGINQLRLHKGYHYPRSKRTTVASLKSQESFTKEYGSCLINNVDHYYCIANEHSLTSAKEYIRFCNENALEYEQVATNLVNPEKIELQVKVKEDLIDLEKLRKLSKKKIRQNNIKLLLNSTFTKPDARKYDYVVIATYSVINTLLPSDSKKVYQFELCEKPVVKLPKKFQRKSIVILDGPFMCIDPFGETDLFLMGNVVQAIHRTKINKQFTIPSRYLPLINKGLIRNPSLTNFTKFIESGSIFIPELKNAVHVGSMYTVRTVLPYKDATDERPTLVNQVDKKMFTIFSGKIVSCVDAAKEVQKRIDSQKS